MRRGTEDAGAEENHVIWRQLDLHIAEAEHEASPISRSHSVEAFAPYKALMPLVFDVAETMAKANATPFQKLKRCLSLRDPCLIDVVLHVSLSRLVDFCPFNTAMGSGAPYSDATIKAYANSLKVRLWHPLVLCVALSRLGVITCWLVRPSIR